MSERPARLVSRRGGLKIEQKRNRVEECERQHSAERATVEPLQLLAQQGRGGACVAAQEEQRSHDVESGVVGRPGLIQTMLQQLGCRAGLDGPNP